jgi:RNase P/RNase MRP subunit POP5
MKPLLPTLKERHRYVVYELITAHPLEQDISATLLGRVEEILGVFGMADAGVLPVTYDPKTQVGILRVTHTEVPRVRAALLLVTHLDRTSVLIRTRGISGMLNKARRFLP